MLQNQLGMNIKRTLFVFVFTICFQSYLAAQQQGISIDSLLANPNAIVENLSKIELTSENLDTLNQVIHNASVKENNYLKAAAIFETLDSLLSYSDYSDTMTLAQFYSVGASAFMPVQKYGRALELYEKSKSLMSTLDSMPYQEYIDLEKHRIEAKTILEEDYDFEKDYLVLRDLCMSKLGKYSEENMNLNSNIGVSFGRKLQFLKGKEYLLQADSIFWHRKEIGKALDKEHTDISMGLGSIFGSIGQINKAIPYFLRSKNLAIKSNDRFMTLYNSHNLGIAFYTLGKSEKALKALSDVLSMGSGFLPPDHSIIVKSEQLKAIVLVDLERYEEGLEAMHENLKKAENLDGQEADLSRLYFSIAHIHWKMKQYGRAIDYLDKSENQLVSLDSTLRMRILMDNYSLKASIYTDMNDTRKSKEFLYKSLQINLGKEYKNEVSITDFKNCRDGSFVIGDLIALGLMDYNNSEFPAAYSRFKNGLSLLNESSDEQDELDNVSNKVLNFELYEGLAMTNIKMVLQGGDLKDDINRVIELAKNDDFLVEMNSGEIERVTGIDLKVLQEERKLKNDFSLLKEQFQRNVKDSVLNVQMLNTRNEIDSINTIIKNRYPKYYHSKIDLSVADTEEIQTYLKKENACALNYMVGLNKLIISAITPDTIIYDIKDLNDLTFLKELKVDKNAYDFVLEYSDALRNTLIPASFLNKMKASESLIISCHDILNFIPFEVLFMNELNEIPPISYAPSFTFLTKRATKKRNKNGATELFAPVYQDSTNFEMNQLLASIEREGLLSLPGAQNEVQKIQEIISGNIFSSKEGLKSKFLQKAPNSKILHLAMHSILNEDSPLYTTLSFGSDDNETLPLHEIYNLDLSSDLVVLSACNTGVGDLNKGKSISSLSNAFSYAGAKSVVLSLWKVPDMATSHIMVRFYQNLKAGQRKDEALKNAKLNYLADDAIPDAQKTPYHWAGFVATGDMSPISFTSSSTKYLWLFGGLVLLAFLGVGAKKVFKSAA